MKQYKYTINGADYDVTIDSLNGNKAKVIVNGMSFDVEMQGTLNESDLPDAPAADASAAPAAPKAAAPAAAPKAATPAGAPGKGTPVKAPLPGVVTAINVNVGQKVKKGETVVVLEAMKMENNIAAECDGTVTSVCVAQGDSVMEGTVLVTVG
ncbi:protein containing Biotin/lipoyl attachment domain protein [Prevotella sp. CAG:617]|nr:protein containing Biotin/lipoyl attachment domain protein [Prevotella sp. CAG:617]